jgi:transcriptional regulator with XRE-family HTH domain
MTAPDRPARRPAVGRQVRRWRVERQMTLAQVAAASGLNTGYLSQIENDKASPSLESLAALGEALDVPISWFLMEATPPPRVIRSADRRAWDRTSGVHVTEVDGGVPRDLCIVQVDAQPGSRSGLHAHHGDEHHVVLAGRWRLTQGDHVVEARPGDYVTWDASIPHDAEVIGDEAASMLLISPRSEHAEGARPGGTVTDSASAADA